VVERKTLKLSSKLIKVYSYQRARTNSPAWPAVFSVLHVGCRPPISYQSTWSMPSPFLA